MMKVKPTSEIEQFLIPFADEIGAEIVEVEFKAGKSSALTVYIDTEDGIDLDTLEKFHNLINDKLDEFDPTYGEPYTLNVSSPGLDRAFKTDRDFERHLGEGVEVKLFAPIKGKKFFEGILTDFDKNTVTIEIDKINTKFERNQIAKINCQITFD